MFKQYFAGFEFTALPLFALALFLLMFVLVLVRTYAFKSQRDFEPQSQMPLFDGKETASHEVTS